MRPRSCTTYDPRKKAVGPGRTLVSTGGSGNDRGYAVWHTVVQSFMLLSEVRRFIFVSGTGRHTTAEFYYRVIRSATAGYQPYYFSTFILFHIRNVV